MKRFLATIISFCTRHPHMIVGLVLFLIPNLFWGKLYDVGGDDSQLYYIFPWEFITQFAHNIVVDNTLGLKSLYVSQAYFIPFFSVIAGIKYILPFIHIQHFFQGLNLFFAFIFFYKFMLLVTAKEKPASTVIQLIVSVGYVLSQFLLKTVYAHQLLSMYLVSVFPAFLYYFVLSLEKKNSKYIFVAAIIYSIFSTGMNTFPWFLGSLITCIPFFIYLFIRYKMRVVTHGALLALTLVGLNLYWLIHQLYPILSGSKGSLNGSVNQNFLQETANLVWSLSRLNSPLNELFSTVRSSWTEFTSFSPQYLANGFFFFIILLAGILMDKNDRRRILYVVMFISLLLSFFLLAPNFGSWSVWLFIFLTKQIPLFSIFRNMFDKFSMGVAFNYALLLGISLLILADHPIIKKYMKVVLGTIIVLILSNALRFIIPIYDDVRYSTRISGHLNTDYLDLVSYIRSMNTTSRFLWLPMNLANYVYIHDTDSGHYYFGPSPLLLLSGATDYTGVLSFGTAFDHSIAYQLQKNLADKNYDVIGKLYQENNVGYIILVTETLSATRKKYLFDLDLFEKQNDEFTDAIVGEKIKDFGDRYSLYTINSNYGGQKIFISDTKESLTTSDVTLSFRKKNSSTFDIELPNFQGVKYLVFKETYNSGWKLFDTTVPSGNALERTNYEVRSNANIFEVNGATDSNKKITLFFVPERYSVIGEVLSIMTLGIVIVFLVRSGKKHQTHI